MNPWELKNKSFAEEKSADKNREIIDFSVGFFIVLALILFFHWLREEIDYIIIYYSYDIWERYVLRSSLSDWLEIIIVIIVGSFFVKYAIGKKSRF
jgi:hypothetical protein